MVELRSAPASVHFSFNLRIRTAKKNTKKIEETYHDRNVEEVHVFVKDVGRLAGCRLRGLGQELRLRHGHVEVKGPVFQPLLLPVDLGDVLSGTRHL